MPFCLKAKPVKRCKKFIAKFVENWPKVKLYLEHLGFGPEEACNVHSASSWQREDFVADGHSVLLETYKPDAKTLKERHYYHASQVRRIG